LTDNLKALDGKRIFSSSKYASISIFYREPNFSKALGYDEKSVFISLILINKSNFEHFEK